MLTRLLLAGGRRAGLRTQLLYLRPQTLSGRPCSHMLTLIARSTWELYDGYLGRR